MADELVDVMADLELALVDTVARLQRAEMDLLYVGVLDLEQRLEALHDALAFVAENIAAGTSPPLGAAQRLPRPAPPGGGASNQDGPASG
jgi:hypothetical protein